jgi:hypothetical protein
MTRSWQYAALVASTLLCAAGTLWQTTGTAGAVDVISPAPRVTPSPLKSEGSLAPLLPPEGLPTAPPPDAIKPVEPQAGPDRRQLEPVAGHPDRGAL